jgi:hypothetical protein
LETIEEQKEIDNNNDKKEDSQSEKDGISIDHFTLITKTIHTLFFPKSNGASSQPVACMMDEY